ncbi:MAG: hypothetical protein KF900_14605 [Bacteroidetes bacterium]|nr:hypothetical protein [Bacteroidota bacterium]
MKFLPKIILLYLSAFLLLDFYSCKKDKFITDPSAKLEFSQDSVMFDTVFTSLGSATQNIRVRNKNKQKIKISSVWLENGSSSQFMMNVDGTKASIVNDIEIAANDSLYIFIQVNVNPTSNTSPFIIDDAIHFSVNGKEQKVVLQAWGQDAYYHKATNTIKFQDGSYLAYSLCDTLQEAFDMIGSEVVWKNDKPHVIFGYLVVDEGQKLKIKEGTQVYLNYKAGIWVYAGGQIQVLGQKDKEVLFTGARFGVDALNNPYANQTGQWDRIWINEGSDNNIIDYAIIKNGYIGIQTEQFGNDSALAKKGQLNLSNTKIQNMSMWGLYSLYYKVLAGNTVISNCQEHSVNISLGGAYYFAHCTFVNFWNGEKTRDKATVRLNNYSDKQTLPLNARFGNCIIDGKLENEILLDVKNSGSFPVTYSISNCWIRTNNALADSDVATFINNVKGGKNDTLKYKDISKYDFQPDPSETKHKNFIGAEATTDAKLFPKDILGTNRDITNVTAGAYEN